MSDDKINDTIKSNLSEPESGFQQNQQGYWCCDLCNHEETSKDEIRTHRILHFAEDHQCPICNKSFNSSTSLKNHLTVHTGIKKYRCKYCGRKFGWKTQLARHESIHTGKGLHHCVICGKSFMTKWILQRHMKVHTKKENKTDLKNQLQRIAFSEACLDQLDYNQDFEQRHQNTLVAFDSHLVQSSQNVTNIQNNKKDSFLCYQCNHTYPSEQELAFHLLEHNKVLDSQCMIRNEFLSSDQSNGDQSSKFLKMNMGNKMACKGSLTTIVSKLHNKVDELKKADDESVDVHIVEASDSQYLNISLPERQDKTNQKEMMSKGFDPFISGITPQHESTIKSIEQPMDTTKELIILQQKIAKQNVVINALKRNFEEYQKKHEREMQQSNSKVDVLTTLVNSQSVIINKIVLGGKMTVSGTLDFALEQANE